VRVRTLKEEGLTEDLEKRSFRGPVDRWGKEKKKMSGDGYYQKGIVPTGWEIKKYARSALLWRRK